MKKDFDQNAERIHDRLKSSGKKKHSYFFRIGIFVLSIVAIAGAGCGIYFGLFASRGSQSSLTLTKQDGVDTIAYTSTQSTPNSATIKVQANNVDQFDWTMRNMTAPTSDPNEWLQMVRDGVSDLYVLQFKSTITEFNEFQLSLSARSQDGKTTSNDLRYEVRYNDDDIDIDTIIQNRTCGHYDVIPSLQQLITQVKDHNPDYAEWETLRGDLELDGTVGNTQATIKAKLNTGYQGSVVVDFTTKYDVTDIMVKSDDTPITNLGTYLEDPSDVDIIPVIEQQVKDSDIAWSDLHIVHHTGYIVIEAIAQAALYYGMTQPITFNII